MKHTDVLLKIQTKPDNEAQEATKAETLNGLQSKLRLVQDLSRTDGWKLFVEELVNERRKLFAMMERANDPTSLAKLTGTLLAVESFIDWPGYVSRELEAQAKDLVKVDDDR